MRETRDFALALWARGLKVIPGPHPDAMHDGRNPSVLGLSSNRAAKLQSENKTRIAAAVSNIAIITDHVSRVVVTDADSRHATEYLPRTCPSNALTEERLKQYRRPEWP